MRTEFRLTNPDEAEATMTITMTIAQWKNVRAAIDKTQRYHTDADDFATQIKAVIFKAEQAFSEIGIGGAL